MNVARLAYERLGFILLGIYTIFIILTILMSYLFYSKKYIRNRKILEEYCEKLEQLDRFYEQGREDADNDTITGI